MIFAINIPIKVFNYLFEFEEGSNFLSAVLIEDPDRALRMLAELLVAVAIEMKNDEFLLSPGRSGNYHFDEPPKLDFYIYRLVRLIFSHFCLRRPKHPHVMLLICVE